MRKLLRTGGAYMGRNVIMLILGGTPAKPLISAGLYERVDYAGS
ncbi:hypothetical protein J2W76_004270 [Methylorubrum zatmanii]|nr:hypothetical protein [Methylorubrum zatmanii]MCP1552362.1 hypothetical protein [Methylorubrum extorquens]MCP1581328.1 hypothetical protein [Methylorubrum extorquens]